MQCSNARLLSSDLRSSRQSEPQQFRIITHSKSNHLKAWNAPVLGVEQVGAI